MLRHIFVTVLAVFALIGHAEAAIYMVEPDDYADGTALTSVNPKVTLSTLDQDNVVVPLFTVTAAPDGFGFAPTGTKVFAHVGVGFWLDIRKLRMDFAEPVSSISLGFAGGTNFDTDFGLLNVYNSSNVLLDSDLTAGMGPGQKETMSINRPINDIAYAIAYSVPGDGPYGPFGRLDALVFDTAVPEPAAGGLLLTAVGLMVRRRRRR
jgi:hypothetical protein